MAIKKQNQSEFLMKRGVIFFLLVLSIISSTAETSNAQNITSTEPAVYNQAADPAGANVAEQGADAAGASGGTPVVVPTEPANSVATDAANAAGALGVGVINNQADTATVAADQAGANGGNVIGLVQAPPNTVAQYAANAAGASGTGGNVTGGGGASTSNNLSANYLGDVICNVETQLNGYGSIFSALCYIIGAFLIASGLFYALQRASDPDNRNQTSTRAITHLCGGSVFLSAPAFVAVLQNSLAMTPGGAAMGSGACGGATPVALSGSIGLDQVLNNLVKNIHGPMFTLLSGISIAVGLFFIARGLLKASKYGMDPRSDNVKNILVNLIIGTILISVSSMLPVMLNSLFGSSSPDNISGWIGLNWNKLGLVPTQTQAADNAVKAGLAFVQIFGGISFVRGWMMIKNAVEGNGNQTVPQGLTHIIGGAMAINIATMLKIIDNTLGTGLVLG